MSCHPPGFPAGGQGELKSWEVDQGAQFSHQGFLCKPLNGMLLLSLAIFRQEGQLLVRRVKGDFYLLFLLLTSQQVVLPADGCVAIFAGVAKSAALGEIIVHALQV